MRSTMHALNNASRLHNPRRLITRCHLLYRHFKAVDFITPPYRVLLQQHVSGGSVTQDARKIGIVKVGLAVHFLKEEGVNW